jgi:hypothetical protein
MWYDSFHLILTLHPISCRYKLIREIGDGTCGNVFMAYSIETNEIVSSMKTFLCRLAFFCFFSFSCRLTLLSHIKLKLSSLHCSLIQELIYDF